MKGLTLSAVSRSPLSYFNIAATRSRNSCLTPLNASSCLSNTLHIPKGVVRNSFASGHVSGVGVPSARKILRMRPNWLPSSWVGGDVKIGDGVEFSEASSDSRTPKDQMSTGVEYDLLPRRASGGR